MTSLCALVKSVCVQNFVTDLNVVYTKADRTLDIVGMGQHP